MYHLKRYLSPNANSRSKGLFLLSLRRGNFGRISASMQINIKFYIGCNSFYFQVLVPIATCLNSH